MKRALIIVGIIVVVGIAVWLASPLFYSREVNESLEDIVGEMKVVTIEEKKTEGAAMAVIVRQGVFEGLAGHNGSGKATLIKAGDKYYVRFEDDFRVTNGPDLYVDLGRSGERDGSARLGRLKGSAGGQNYEVPAGIDVSQYDEVWIWCRAFSVPFAKAGWGL